jgi:hypothetical protein
MIIEPEVCECGGTIVSARCVIGAECPLRRGDAYEPDDDAVTQMDWDSSVWVAGPNGGPMLTCENGHVFEGLSLVDHSTGELLRRKTRAAGRKERK